MPATQPVWLDCDPGHDDMCAIILAGHHDALSLLGISTVSGNQSLDKTTLNAAKVLVIAGLEHVSVTPGQARPILSLPFHDAEIHGKTGLDGTDLLPSADEVPAGIVRRDDKGVLAMARAIMASERPVSLVATGALTNVALMLQLFPEAKPHIREVVLMGGAVGVGNRGSVMEFNILCDPEAAAVVFESGLKVVMVPLEVTHTALITEAVLEEIRALGTPTAEYSCSEEPALTESINARDRFKLNICSRRHVRHVRVAAAHLLQGDVRARLQHARPAAARPVRGGVGDRARALRDGADARRRRVRAQNTGFGRSPRFDS